MVSCLLYTGGFFFFFFAKQNDSVLDKLEKFLNHFIYDFYGALKCDKI